MEHPTLWATLRSGEELLPPGDRPIPLPPRGRLVHLPGRLPVGLNPETGTFELVRELKVGGKTFTPHAVGALLPPGYTRSFLPGEVKADGPVLPQWAYTAAAWGPEGPVAWAIHTDRRTHWSPERYSTPELKHLVGAHLARFPGNRVLQQLRTCALVYNCFTSQNIFYQRDEGAIPASVMCNARCVGCISEQPADGQPAASININTNASLPHALEALFDAGLDAVRVSLNSAVKDLYEAYYQPVKYGWEEVESSIALARRRGAYVALNLLTFPGVTDREGEVEALARLIRRHRVDQVQTRSLCIDPLQYLEVAHGRGGGGSPIGIRAMLARLRRQAPWLSVGNFARALHERGKGLS